MKEVYIAIVNNEVQGVFSTLEKAQTFLTEEIKPRHRRSSAIHYSIQVFTIDNY